MFFVVQVKLALKLQTFSEIFWALHSDYSQCKKSNTRKFFLFIYLGSYNDKSKFLVQ